MTDPPAEVIPGAPETPAPSENAPLNKPALAGMTVAAVVLLWLCFRILYPFLPAIFGALIFAVALAPVQDIVRKHIPQRSLAALAVTLLVLLLVIVPIGYLAVNISSQANDLYQWLDQQADVNGGWKPLLTRNLQVVLEWISTKTGISAPNLQTEIMSRAQAATNSLVQWGGSIVGNFFSSILTVLLVLIILFFLLRDGARWVNIVGNWVPLPNHRYQQLLNAFKDSILANLYGSGAVALAQGALLGIAFAIVGIPSALLWSVITAFISLIPLLGSFLVWVPAAIWLGVTGHVGKAIFIVIWGFGVVSTVDNFLRPYIMSGRVNMGTLPIFFSLLGGVQLFGFVGLFAGPVIFALTSVVLEILDEEMRARYHSEPLPQQHQT